MIGSFQLADSLWNNEQPLQEKIRILKSVTCESNMPQQNYALELAALKP